MSELHIVRSRPRIVRIEDIVDETPTVRTLLFRDEPCLGAEGGQFVMVWIPSVDEIPMSISVADFSEYSAITVKPQGEASLKLYSVKVGDIIGIRGPYGNSFTPEKDHALIVGGGTGLAPLALLCSRSADYFERITVLIGARTRSEVLFEERFRRILKGRRAEIVVSTDDGSYGLKGLLSERVEEILDKSRVDSIYACGPELMLREVFDLGEEKGIRVQASLERVMKCGIGLCGSCCIGKYLVCMDGPVFESERLREVIHEFGSFKLDAAGRIVKISN